MKLSYTVKAEVPLEVKRGNFPSFGMALSDSISAFNFIHRMIRPLKVARIDIELAREPWNNGFFVSKFKWYQCL